jgi:hypothetical protein
MVVGQIDAQVDISFLCVEVWSACSLKKCTIPTHRDDNLSAYNGHTSATAKAYTLFTVYILLFTTVRVRWKSDALAHGKD